MTPTVAIIGAGIGGLSCALALQRIGIAASVYDEAADLAPVGAGIGLWPGAVRSLRRIGIADWFWQLPVCHFGRAETTTPKGRVLVGFDLPRTIGADGFVVRRADLHRALAEAIDPSRVTLAARAVTLTQSAGSATVTFANGREVAADVVIGADGVRSIARSALFGFSEPRYSGETCYRGMATLSVRDRQILREGQGPGLRAAVHPLDSEHVYWWATRRAPANEIEPEGGRREFLLETFSGWRTGIVEAISATEEGTILKNDLYDRPALPTWTKGRATLLGDAAHPTTPNLGLGGCMAIEDALVLARAFANHPSNHVKAFAQYEQERRSRTRQVVRLSRWFGRLGSLTNPTTVRAREVTMSLTPNALAAKSFLRPVSYDPGPLPRPPGSL